MAMSDIAWEWYRDKKTGMKHRRISVPKDQKRRERLKEELINVVLRMDQYEEVLKEITKKAEEEKRKEEEAKEGE